MFKPTKGTPICIVLLYMCATHSVGDSEADQTQRYAGVVSRIFGSHKYLHHSPKHLVSKQPRMSVAPCRRVCERLLSCCCQPRFGCQNTRKSPNPESLAGLLLLNGLFGWSRHKIQRLASESDIRLLVNICSFMQTAS